MSAPNIFDIENQRHRAALQAVERVREACEARKQVNASPAEDTRQSGTIYGRRGLLGRFTQRLSLPEVLRRIKRAEIPMPAKNEVRERLYPSEGKRGDL